MAIDESELAELMAKVGVDEATAKAMIKANSEEPPTKKAPKKGRPKGHGAAAPSTLVLKSEM